MKKILFLLVFLIIDANITRITFAQSENHINNLVFVQGNYLRNLGTFGQVWSQAAGGYLGYGIYFPEHNLLMFRTGFMNHALRN